MLKIKQDMSALRCADSPDQDQQQISQLKITVLPATVHPLCVHAPQCQTELPSACKAQLGLRACMDASRAWLCASTGAPAAPRMSTLTAKMTPDATGQLYAPLREMTISRKMPDGTQLHKEASGQPPAP